MFPRNLQIFSDQNINFPGDLQNSSNFGERDQVQVAFPGAQRKDQDQIQSKGGPCGVKANTRFSSKQFDMFYVCFIDNVLQIYTIYLYIIYL